MSYKRSRATFEADLQAQQSPFVLYGTALPPADSEVRDDGSYVPVWKQEVRDERGRKRLHGAFTGGFSAGYFNTVGSKEGWTPSTFVSSRTNRHKDDARSAQKRREEIMDDEDLADAAEAEKLQTAQAFAGLGSTEEDGIRRGGLADLFRAQGETMGVKLLRRMGWKDGQGIGPKVRREARLDVGGRSGAIQDEGGTYLFAPENVPMIAFIRKLDRKGLGYDGEPRLTPARPVPTADAGESSDEEACGAPLRRPNAFKKKAKAAKGGIGIGILNDNGSDDEDPYEIGPRISYNRVIGGDNKKKKKAVATSANSALRSTPVFISSAKRNALAKAGKNLRKCHDGRLPLDGFVFGSDTDSLTSAINSDSRYPPPQIPPDWKSSKQRQAEAENQTYISTADAAKASKLDPKSRAALLGEAQLPGKSVFDFLSPAARDRLANATGKSNLPPALGQVPEGYALSEAERRQELLRQIPELDKQTAIAAMARGASGAAPYADDEAKRGRYRAYLEHAAGFVQTLPSKPSSMSTEDWLRELNEFHSCARIFRPMSGVMASRFTTSSSSSSTLNPTTSSSNDNTRQQDLLSKPPPPKPKDPAEEAASLGMYGAMTRSVADFYPSRLLCKRFNVKPPAHVQPDGDAAAEGANGKPKPKPTFGSAADFGASAGRGDAAGGAMTLDEMLVQAQSAAGVSVGVPPREGEGHMAAAAPPPVRGGLRENNNGGGSSSISGSISSNHNKPAPPPSPPPETTVEVNAEVNEAVEGKRAQDEVLKAIFGDSSDDDD
ncbi:DUF1604-domain-containing protein [Xylariomycetidae sp. FL2044]|nr:DUF1604-domain-containing protein [Xylariomycetidae sp. FL2044]